MFDSGCSPNLVKKSCKRWAKVSSFASQVLWTLTGQLNLELLCFSLVHKYNKSSQEDVYISCPLVQQIFTCLLNKIGNFFEPGQAQLRLSILRIFFPKHSPTQDKLEIFLNMSSKRSLNTAVFVRIDSKYFKYDLFFRKWQKKSGEISPKGFL